MMSSSIKSIAQSTFTFVIALALSACASTYRSPGLPAGDDSQMAVLEPKEFSRMASFFIVAVDDQPRGIGWFDRFELEPGRRSITAAVNSYSLRGDNITKFFTARAGVRYFFVVHVDNVAKRWGFSIEEAETGRRVDTTYR